MKTNHSLIVISGSVSFVNVKQKQLFLNCIVFVFSAWFVDNVIESDGRAFLSTPVDPLLLALPYLRSAKRAVPLDHLLLEDEKDFPEAANRLAGVLIAKGLSPIANSKGKVC